MGGEKDWENGEEEGREGEWEGGSLISLLDLQQGADGREFFLWGIKMADFVASCPSTMYVFSFNKNYTYARTFLFFFSTRIKSIFPIIKAYF